MAASHPPETLPDDPRLDPQYVRRLPGTDEADPVTLVGIVHDHPASIHRVQSVLRRRDPAVVALEVSPWALSLFDGYADDDRTPPVFGGEVSAAIQAAPDARHVGVDGPNRRFYARLARALYDERASLATIRRTVSSVWAVSRHALRCRFASALARRASVRVEVDDPITHDCEVADPPAVQAADERRCASRNLSLLRATDPPESIGLRDTVREAEMASRIETLRRTGDVVAVVGLGHLDALAARLKTSS